MSRMRYALLCLPLVAIALPLQATTIQATTYASWSAQLTGTPAFVDLETLASGDYGTAGGVMQGSYRFNGPDGSGWSLGVQTFGNKTGIYGASDGVGRIEAILPGTGQSAIYFYANTEANNTITNGSLTLTLSDGESLSISSGQFGLNISHPITWYALSATSGQAAFLQWAYFGNSSLPQDGGTGGGGTPGQAPEAATIALVGGGILILFGSKRNLAQKLSFS